MEHAPTVSQAALLGDFAGLGKRHVVGRGRQARRPARRSTPRRRPRTPPRLSRCAIRSKRSRRSPGPRLKTSGRRSRRWSAPAAREDAQAAVQGEPRSNGDSGFVVLDVLGCLLADASSGGTAATSAWRPPSRWTRPGLDALASAVVAMMGPAREADPRTKEGIIALVEDFFRHNFRDVTSRETIEWADYKKTSEGNYSIRYKYRARIWDRETKIINQVFTFDPEGKFVSVKDVVALPSDGDRESGR